MAEEVKMTRVAKLIEDREELMRKALGTKRDFDSWWSVAKMWIAKTEGTLPYDKVTKGVEIVDAFLTAAKLGLMIDGEECMVMIRGKADPKVKCEVGYRGVVRLAGQSGIIVNAGTIKAGDDVEIDEGMGIAKHTQAWLKGREQGDTLGYYAVATQRDGRRTVRAISLADVKSKHSTGRDVWASQHADRMGEKTAILQLKKFLSFGDFIDDLLAKTGFDAGFDEEEEPEPQHPPQTTRDKVLAAAARAEQDAAAEAPQYDDSDPI